MANFIDEFFLNPIRYPAQYAPYNIVNTAAYALIALVAVYLIYRGIQKMKIRIDGRFYNALLPFIAFGSVLRVTEDAGMLPRTVTLAGMEFHPFVTPYIYVLIFLILAATVLILRAVKTKPDKLYGRVALTGGILAAAVFLWELRELSPRITSESLSFLVYTLLLAALPVLVFELLKRKFNAAAKPETKRLEQTTVMAQSFDGAATFVGVALAGYSEQHIVANTIFAAFGNPIAFYFLKMAFVIGIVFLLRKEASDKQEHTFLLLLVTLLGLAPGLRDTLRVLFGV